MAILQLYTVQILISEKQTIQLIMFEHLINQILGAEKVSALNRQEEVTTPDVTEKSSIAKPIPEKYKNDIEALREKYSDFFSTRFCIEITLKELLELCPRERHRKDAYHGLVSYLSKELGIKLLITSQKSKL